MAKLDDLKIYKVYYDFMKYNYLLLRKYPISERYFLTSNIKSKVDEGMEVIIKVNKEYDNKRKITLLNGLDMILSMLLVYYRLSYSSKFITKKNYESASRKVTVLNNMLLGLLKTCKV